MLTQILLKSYIVIGTALSILKDARTELKALSNREVSKTSAAGTRAFGLSAQ
jgi:hypothetical protein